MKSNNKSARSSAQDTLHWIGLMAFVIGLWAWMGYYAKGLGGERGLFGDMFGAVNALFTGLAFAGVVMTIRLQMKEMSDTRDVLEKQQKQMKLQADTASQQAADANFFRLLEIFRNMAQNMRHPGGYPESDYLVVATSFSVTNIHELRPLVYGVEYWRILSKICLKEIKAPPTSDTAQLNWREIFKRWDTSLAPYFATLAELLLMISEAEEKTGRRWAQLLRAQLGLQEMIPIFFHALSPVGQQRLKPQIEKFGIFTHFSDDPSYQNIAIRGWYLPGAFLPQGIT